MVHGSKLNSMLDFKSYPVTPVIAVARKRGLVDPSC